MTDADHAFIAAAIEGSNVWVNPDTFMELRRRLSDYNRLAVALPESSPINAGLRIYVDLSRRPGRVHGPNDTSMSLDTFCPLISIRPSHG